MASSSPICLQVCGERAGHVPPVTVLHVVAGGPDGEIRYLTSLTDGVLEAHEVDAVDAEEVAGGASGAVVKPDV